MSDRLLVVMALELESAGAFDGHGLSLLHTGVGKVNAAYALTRRLTELKLAGKAPQVVVNFGTAGSRRFEAGTLVACNRFVQRDMDVRGLGFALGETPFESVPPVLTFETLFPELPQATCGSADRFETVHDHDGTDVVEMEAYALAKVCHLEGMRFACVKFISDGADSDAAKDWQENVAVAAQAFLRMSHQLVAQLERK